jgi:hypothetical protein
LQPELEPESNCVSEPVRVPIEHSFEHRDPDPERQRKPVKYAELVWDAKSVAEPERHAVFQLFRVSESNELAKRHVVSLNVTIRKPVRNEKPAADTFAKRLNQPIAVLERVSERLRVTVLVRFSNDVAFRVTDSEYELLQHHKSGNDCEPDT